MKKLSVIVILGMIFTTLISCTEGKTETEKVQPKRVSEKSRPQVNTISINELKEKFLGKEGVVLIDNRPAFKHKKEGKIEGSLNMPYFVKGHTTNVMTKQLLEKYVKKSDTIVFYCSGNVRAYHAALAAVEWGYDPQKIFWYKGGWREWKTKGNDV